MATSANRSRIFPARSKRSYRLEMEGRTLYLLLTLMVLTGVVVFYLGVVTGKAMRNPNAPVALSVETPAPGGTTLSSQGLAFNEALKAKDPLIEGLRTEGEQTSERTQQLLQQGERRLELQEVSPGGESTAAPSRQPASESTAGRGTPEPARQPAATADSGSQPSTAAPAASEERFTVQVFTSRYEKNARDLVDRLRNMGFSAYLNRYETTDRGVLYRVRVGRTDHAEAEELSRRLRTEANLKNPQIRKL